MARLLIIDDDESVRLELESAFRRQGHQVTAARNAREAGQQVSRQLFEIIICDVNLPDQSGLEVLEQVRQQSPESVFLLITGYDQQPDTIIKALNLGADRYVNKGPRLSEELEHWVRRAEDYLRVRRERDLFRQRARELASDNLVGQSRALRAVLETAQAVAPTQSTILLTGESGTGKELVARRIHDQSPRYDRPFVGVNCGAFPETLLESELFGYLKGAFTGAAQNKEGLFQAARSGTLFLDEIGEMSLPMQVKLLRVLQERKVRPLGSTQEIDIDVRLIAATNKDLTQLVAEKTFRDDLYYRISVIPIHVPPLRERPEDIPLLAGHFLRRFSREMGRAIQGFEEEALELLSRYAWPGNVRELENAVERGVALETGERISVRSLPERIVRGATAGPSPAAPVLPPEGMDLEAHVQNLERSFLVAAIERSAGVRTKAAELLRMSYRSFRHYAKKYGV